MLSSIFQKPKIPIPFCSIMLSDNYINRACSWNWQCLSIVQQKNHPRIFCEAFLSVLTLLAWHKNFGKMLLVSNRTFCWHPPLMYTTWFDQQVGRFILSSYKLYKKVIYNVVIEFQKTIKKFMATGIAQKSCSALFPL